MSPRPLIRRTAWGRRGAAVVAAALLLPATATAQSNLPAGERLDADGGAVANAFSTFDAPPLQLLTAPEARQAHRSKTPTPPLRAPATVARTRFIVG